MPTASSGSGLDPLARDAAAALILASVCLASPGDGLVITSTWRPTTIHATGRAVDLAWRATGLASRGATLGALLAKGVSLPRPRGWRTYLASPHGGTALATLCRCARALAPHLDWARVSVYIEEHHYHLGVDEPANRSAARLGPSTGRRGPHIGWYANPSGQGPGTTTPPSGRRLAVGTIE